MTQSYRDLDVWVAALELSQTIYRMTARFPMEERFALVDQMRRASVSIPSNIAEGHGRYGNREYLHHLSIANGSLMELETLVLLAQRIDLLADADSSELIGRTQRIGRMLTRLRQRLRAN